jgi:hypothetical protein
MSKVWLLIILFTGSIACWFSQLAIREAWAYSRVNMTVPVLKAAWKPIEITPDRFVLEATYEYEVQGLAYHNRTQFNEPIYLNLPTAELDQQRWEKLVWNAWVNPAHPEESTLQRLFPWKHLFYSLVTLSVFGYFFSLRKARQFSDEQREQVS